MLVEVIEDGIWVGTGVVVVVVVLCEIEEDEEGTGVVFAGTGFLWAGVGGGGCLSLRIWSNSVEMAANSSFLSPLSRK